MCISVRNHMIMFTWEVLVWIWLCLNYATPKQHFKFSGGSRNIQEGSKIEKRQTRQEENVAKIVLFLLLKWDEH